MTTTLRGPVLTIGELRRLIADIPDHALVALSLGESQDTFADLETMFVDASRNGLLVFRPPDRGTFTLFDAVEADDRSLVQTLVAEGADVNVRDPRSPMFDGATPLTLAAEGGRVAMTNLLLKLGADVDARSASGWTALMRACNAGQLETARILLEAGADATLVNDEGYTAYGRVPGNNPALLGLLAQWEASQRAAAPDAASSLAPFGKTPRR
jgi:ankyrin repeat protein